MHFAQCCLFGIFLVTFSNKNVLLNEFNIFFFFFFSLLVYLVISRVLLFITICESFKPVELSSSSIVQATMNIVDRFYNQQSSTVFIMYQTSLAFAHSPNPNEMVGEIVQFVGDRISSLYVVESHASEQFHHRNYNVFFIDSYDSFR